MDLTPKGEENLLHLLLQDLMGGPYQEDLCIWLMEYKHLFGPASKWLLARGLDFHNYVVHLKEDGLCDVLEVWLVSLILQQPLNMVQESTVQCTYHLSLDFQYTTYVLSSYGHGVLFTLDQSDEEPVPVMPTRDANKVD